MKMYAARKEGESVEDNRERAAITMSANNIPLFGRDGKYIAGINCDKACELEDSGKVVITNGEAHQV